MKQGELFTIDDVSWLVDTDLYPSMVYAGEPRYRTVAQLVDRRKVLLRYPKLIGLSWDLNRRTAHESRFDMIAALHKGLRYAQARSED